VVCESAIAWLSAPSSEPPFDIVFSIRHTIRRCWPQRPALERRLAPDARVYLERRAREPLPACPRTGKSFARVVRARSGIICFLFETRVT
jgi:hypothetical protein